MIVTKFDETDFKALAIGELFEAVKLEMYRIETHYQNALLEIPVDAIARLTRIHTNPMTFATRPYSPSVAEIPWMSQQASFEVRKLVYRHTVPKLVNHFHYIPDKNRPILNSSRYAERGADILA